MRAVYVKWVDSATLFGGKWISIDELPEEEVLCENVGFLVKESEHSIWLAGKWAPEEVGSVDQIPRVAITYIKELDLDGSEEAPRIQSGAEEDSVRGLFG